MVRRLPKLNSTQIRRSYVRANVESLTFALSLDKTKFAFLRFSESMLKSAELYAHHGHGESQSNQSTLKVEQYCY